MPQLKEMPFPKNAILDCLKEEDYWIEPEKGQGGSAKTQKKEKVKLLIFGALRLWNCAELKRGLSLTLRLS